MAEFQVQDVKDFICNPFEKIGKDWMLVAAGNEEKVNTMTVSWGGMGVFWGRNVAYLFVRHSRYTKEFIDAAEGFSLSFYDTAKYRKMMSYVGNVSGREEDKIKNAGLTVMFHDEVPYFAEAETVLLCRKLIRQNLAPEGFVDEKLGERWYSGEDEGNYHDMYIAEITQILKKTED